MAESRKIGYVRVSAKDQNEGRQLEALKELGISERDIYVDKQSGKDFDRPEYQILKRVLRKGDILYVHSLDRLGRNKDAILKEWNEITQEIQADIIVIDMPLLDTTKYKDSVGTFVADLVLQILSWIAEEERKKIRIRQAEGISNARKQGKELGRPKATITDNFIDAYKRWKAGEITAIAAMNETEVGKTTFYKLVKEYEAKL
ncbi:recombinase family protein [Bacillus bombysepticus]|uniref:recombinase family protein n=1 Tax=Bacillus cereus group TaxID=86661 RepID=UPI000BF9B17A|nr:MULTISPECIES: recombinase family protein [Bacillus cereus group]MCU5242632.1 recombinase family protein [Bacillus cereus]PEU54109.1 DNA recombinase [Bacillus cereus]TKA07950.1 recombinase family protein [Bacillus thuringiensis]